MTYRIYLDIASPPGSPSPVPVTSDGNAMDFHPVNMEIQWEIHEKHGLNMASTSVDHRF